MSMPKIVRRAPSVTIQGEAVITGYMDRPSMAAPSADVVQLHQSDEVLATIPKAFKLTDDDHNPHTYPVGTYMMPRDHAMHWYAKANGVKLANTTKPVTA